MCLDYAAQGCRVTDKQWRAADDHFMWIATAHPCPQTFHNGVPQWTTNDLVAKESTEQEDMAKTRKHMQCRYPGPPLQSPRLARDGLPGGGGWETVAK